MTGKQLTGQQGGGTQSLSVLLEDQGWNSQRARNLTDTLRDPKKSQAMSRQWLSGCGAVSSSAQLDWTRRSTAAKLISLPITDLAITRASLTGWGMGKAVFSFSPTHVVLFCHTRNSFLGVDIIVPILQRYVGFPWAGSKYLASATERPAHLCTL